MSEIGAASPLYSQDPPVKRCFDNAKCRKIFIQNDTTHLSTTPGDVSTVESEEGLTVPPAGDPEEEYFTFAGLGFGFFGVVLKRPLNLYNGHTIFPNLLRGTLKFLYRNFPKFVESLC